MVRVIRLAERSLLSKLRLCRDIRDARQHALLVPGLPTPLFGEGGNRNTTSRSARPGVQSSGTTVFATPSSPSRSAI